MIEPDHLTPDRFLGELRERADALRLEGIEVPPNLDSAVQGVLAESRDPFEFELFRLAAAHLIDGLDLELAHDEAGCELLADRVWSLPANLRVSLKAATERLEQAV